MSRARSTRPKDCPYVGKGGLKLAFALDHFAVDPSGMLCADLGCNVGGFTDCLLQRGARKVYAVDTGYGTLAWKLRTDECVVTVERTNALHWEAPERFDLLVIDLGWTRQSHILPTASGMITPTGRVLSLVKPSYEAPKELLHGGVLEEKYHEQILEKVKGDCPASLTMAGLARSPVVGSGGNVEYWLNLVTRGQGA
jgi:23S rRNA (cytidine1920-2'-O)/16S rRNA (cytidine1409-2'-O)-methyltransferase